MNRSVFAGVLVAFAVSSVVQAGPLDGRSVRLENLYQGSPFPGYTVDFTVNSAAGAVEVSDWHGDHNWSIDLYDTGPNTASALLTEFRDTGGRFAPRPNLIYFQLLDGAIPSLLSVTIGDASTLFNDPTRVSFSAGSFGFDVGDLPNGVDRIRLDLTFASVAPEPSTLAGAVVAVGIVGLRRLRRPLAGVRIGR